MATAEELQRQIDAMQVKLQELQSSLEKSQTMTRDAYLQILNTKTVGVNGKLGGLSSADTLSSAPVGDAKVLRDALDINADRIGAISKNGSFKVIDHESISLFDRDNNEVFKAGSDGTVNSRNGVYSGDGERTIVKTKSGRCIFISEVSGDFGTIDSNGNVNLRFGEDGTLKEGKIPLSKVSGAGTAASKGVITRWWSDLNGGSDQDLMTTKQFWVSFTDSYVAGNIGSMILLVAEPRYGFSQNLECTADYIKSYATFPDQWWWLNGTWRVLSSQHHASGGNTGKDLVLMKRIK